MHQTVENTLRIWKVIKALRNTSPPTAIGIQLTLHGWNTSKEERKKKDDNKKKSLSAPRDVSLSPPLSPSCDSVHAFSRELALADSVAGASGSAGAHMTIDAFGTPWAFVSCKTRTRSHQQILFFLCAIQCERADTSPGRGKNRHV